MTIAFAAASLVERVGWLLVHSVWQFALIAIVLAVALRIMRGAPAGARYAAALLGWGLMLIAPAVTWPLLTGVAPQAEVMTTVSPAVDAVDEPVPMPVAGAKQMPTPAEAFDATVVEVAQDISSAPANVIASPVKWAEKLAARIAPWLNTVVVIWCAGVCLFGARSARGWFTLQGLLRRDVVSVPDEMTTLLVSVLKRIGLHHRVRLLQSPHVEVPLVVGWLRPVILLPVCVATGFPPQQLEAILAHELAHVRRHDYLINLLQNLSETVFFYHPALWWASAVVRREREHCCDELAARALGNRAEYGRALLALEELRGTTPSLALGAKGGSLLERIRRLAQLERSPRFGAGGAIGLTILSVLVVIAVLWAVASAGVDADRKEPASNSGNATSPDAKTDEELDANAERDLGFLSGIRDPRRIPLSKEQHVLSLTGPRFTDANLSQLDGFSKLTDLLLIATKVNGDGLKQLESLPQLERLTFAGAAVTDEWLEQLPTLPHLKGLTLYSGRVTDAVLLLLKRYPTLESLQVGNMRIGDEGVAVLEHLPALKLLELRHTLVSDTGLEKLAHVPNLEHFTLASPNVTGSGLVHVAKLQHLQHLQFDGQSVTDEWLRAVEPLRNVTWFGLYGTNVKSSGLSAIERWTSLRQLYLNNNPLTDDVVPHLKELFLLNNVELRQTQVTADGAKRLRDALPDTSVAVDVEPEPQAAAGASSARATESETKESARDDRIRFAIIQAKHVLLLDGNQIVTWKEIDEKIAELPDPSRAYPQLYVTRGARETGIEETASKEVFELHRKYDLSGHSEGSLTPRTDVRYDRIQTPGDLVPDPALRVEGTVVGANGNPVAGAEVVLITPVDESLPYKVYDIAIVEGRIRNPVDELLTTTDSSGRFAVYPPKDTPFSLLALHPDVGIALIDGEQFRTDPKLTLLRWSEVVVDLVTKPESDPQSTTLDTRLNETMARPAISLAQYWVDVSRPARRRGGDESAERFEFTHVPPIWQTSIMRSFPAENGTTHSIPGASISVLPGERRRIALGPVTEQQQEFLKGLRDRLEPRAQAAPPETSVAVAAETGPQEPTAATKQKRAEWVAKLLRLKNHNQTAFAVGPLMIFELPADDALAVTREAWPQIKVDEVKTGLLKTFEFDRHPQVLEVLDLGATDNSEKVRKYACRYLANYAFRDFGGDREQYAAWRKETAGKPVREVIKANAEWFVKDLKSKTPVNDTLWWLELKMMLNVGGNKSSYPKKAVYLRDAGFLDLLNKWSADPQAGPHVKAGAAELNREIQAAIGDAEHAAP